MAYEDLLETVGSFGAYQKLLSFTLIPLTTGIVAMTYYTQIFILTAPPHHCDQVLHQENLSSPFTISRFNISEEIFSKGNFSESDFQCHQYRHEDIDLILNTTNETSVLPSPHQKCMSGWVYDFDSLFDTVTAQNNWVCDDAWRPYVIVTCFWIGNTGGALIFGALSDKVGRRPIIAASLLVYGAAGVISVFVYQYFWAFLTLRVITGLSHHTVSHLSFILVVEYCGIKSRVIPLLIVMISYTAGSLIAPGLALVFWSWRTIALASSVPTLSMLLFYRWLPESPSWMMAKGKISQMVNQLHKVAKFNKKNVTEEDLLDLVTSMNLGGAEKGQHEDEKANTPLTQILKYPLLRKNVFAVLYVWMIGCMCFYGHSQNIANLGTDIFVNYILGATIEIPTWALPSLIQKFGRKISLIVCFLLSGVAGLIYAALPIHMEKVIFTFALLGRLFISGAYYITLQYGPEIFPTVIRGRGVAMTEMLGGIAIFVSPLIVYQGEKMRTLPLIIFSILALSGGLITLILPETKGKALPQTLSQAELFAKHAAPLYPCLQRNRKSSESTKGTSL